MAGRLRLDGERRRDDGVRGAVPVELPAQRSRRGNLPSVHFQTLRSVTLFMRTDTCVYFSVFVSLSVQKCDIWGEYG